MAALREGATDYVLKDRLSRLPESGPPLGGRAQGRQARQAAEERIHEQAALLDEAREAIIVHDLDRNVTFWNRGAERLYGWDGRGSEGGRGQRHAPPEARALRQRGDDCRVQGRRLGRHPQHRHP